MTPLAQSPCMLKCEAVRALAISPSLPFSQCLVLAAGTRVLSPGNLTLLSLGDGQQFTKAQPFLSTPPKNVGAMGRRWAVLNIWLHSYTLWFKLCCSQISVNRNGEKSWAKEENVHCQQDQPCFGSGSVTLALSFCGKNLQLNIFSFFLVTWDKLSSVKCSDRSLQPDLLSVYKLKKPHKTKAPGWGHCSNWRFFPGEKYRNEENVFASVVLQLGSDFSHEILKADHCFNESDFV